MNVYSSKSFGRMKLGDYLCRRLSAAGANDVFGVPGDFNLSFFDEVVKSELNYVGCCNELNASYAADGYARLHGLGCVMTTYAVGELSAINGIAGAYAECVPVIMIAGAPARKFFKDMPLLHHTLGDYMTPYKMYQPVTVDQCILNDPRTAAREIERCLKNCLLYKRPIYIMCPSDMVEVEIEMTEGWPGRYTPPSEAEQVSVIYPRMCSIDYIEEPESSPSSLEEAVDEVVAMIKKSTNPVFIPGVELIRRGLQSSFQKLTTKSNIPYATMLLSKGLITESHPNFMGLYMGARSSPEVQKCLADSDCVIILGEKLTDFNTGGFTSDFKPKSTILVNYDEVQISSHCYRHVYITSFINALLERVPVMPAGSNFPRAMYACPNRRDSIVPCVEGAKLTMNYVFKQLAINLPEKSVFMAETGASMFSAAETMLPDGGIYMGQTFYGSIGYTVGACLGACMALKRAEITQRSCAKGGAAQVGEGETEPNTESAAKNVDGDVPKRRVILSIGDGSFQLTGQEVSTMIRYGCTPIILLVNNDGYTIERVITDNTYNNIAMWDYTLVPKVFGGKEGTKAKTQREFFDAMEYANKHPDELIFIEAILDRWDCNKLLKAAGRMMALNNGLNPSISEEDIQNTE